MTDLAPGTTVTVENPGQVVTVTSPGLVESIWVKEGPTGPQGPGGTPGGPAGGDLSGTYPNPTVAAKDAAAGTASMRTLGTGAQQAAAGDHKHGAGDITTGAFLVARLGTGTPAAGTYVDGGTGAWTNLPAGGGGSGLLVAKSYSAADKSTTSFSLVDVDAVNLAVTFTAPASGRVIVRLSAVSQGPSSGGLWGVRNGTTDVIWGMASAGAVVSPISRMFLISGLTAGNSYTYKWGFAAAETGTLGLLCTGSKGPAVMEVWSA